jgi:opacity protein-like surface antigen
MKHFNSKSRQKPAFHKILVITMAFFFLALPAHAVTEGPYFTLTGSIDTFEEMALSSVDSSLASTNIGAGFEDTGLGFNHSIGYQFKNSFSAELEFSYKGRDFRGAVDGDMTSKSFIANGIYSFNIREFYTPYVGYGIGYTFHEVNIQNYGDRTDTTLAHQLKMGVDMEFSRRLSLRVGYRYFTTNSPTFKQYFSSENSSHGIEAGVKFHF